MLRSAVLSLLLGFSALAHAFDCNLNAVDDATEPDCNANAIPDACDLFPLAFTPRTVPLASTAGASIAAELTGDGPLDLAVVNPTTNAITILVGAGDGTFTTGAIVPVGAGPEAIAGANLSSAVISLGSDIALVVANGTGNSVSVLQNGGDGTFTNITGSPFALLGHPNGVAIGDVTGDGEPDLIVSRRDAGGVSAFVNDGSGGFAPSSYFAPTGAGARSVLLADVNGDHYNDALVANRTAGTVSYLENFGGAAFLSAVTVATVADPAALALADVNADGMLDLSVLSSVDGSVHLFLGDGTGAFTAGATVATTPDGTGLRLVDMDGNGSPDVVVTSGTGDAAVVSLSDVAGTFGPAFAFPAGDGPAGIVTGDFDGDGRTDLAVPDGLANAVTVLHSAASTNRDCDASGVPDTCEPTRLDCNANGVADTCDAVSPVAFAAGVDTPLADVDAPLAVGDLDGDGRADVVARRSPSKIVIARGQADGTVVESGSFVVPGTPSRILLTDVDADGDRDVVVTSSAGDGVYVLRTDGHGSVTGTDIYPEPNAPLAIVAGELTGDTHLDLAVGETATSALRIVNGASDGTFTLGASIALAGLPAELVAGDVDGDGDADIVALVVTGGITTSLQIVRNAGGTLTAEPAFLAPPTGTAAVGLVGADWNGDGALDLAFMQLDFGTGIARLRTLLASAGSYAGGQTLPFFQAGGATGPLPIVLLPSGIAADFDGDGHVDLAWPTLGGHAIAVLRNHGDGTLDALRTIPAGTISSRGVGAGDVTGDGAVDLVAPEYATSDAIVVLPGLARPDVDTNADGVADCRQEIRCGDCADDDGDGLVDGADPDCAATALRRMRMVVQPAHGRKPARAKLVADAASAATFDPATTAFGVGVADPALYCGTPPLRARGKRVVRLSSATGSLRALVVQLRPKGRGFRLRATLSPLDPALAAGDVVRAWLGATTATFRGEVTLRAKGKRLVGS